MTEQVTTATAGPHLDNALLELGPERFHIQRSSNHHYSVTISDLESSDAPLERTLGLRTGSHHMEVFWVESGSGNMQVGFPFTWLIDEKRWVPRIATFLRDPSAPAPREVWNAVCIRCHSTGGQAKPASDGKSFNSRVAELGISCEACHGPAESHVRKHQAAKLLPSTREKSKGDPTITQPARLDHKRSSQVCGHCHSLKWFEADADYWENGFSFRPGDDLEAVTPVIRPAHLDKQPWLTNVVAKNPGLFAQFFWPDGMMRVTGREYNGLVESPCFQRGQLSCVSCHSLHQSSPNDQLARGMESNEACFQCHQPFREKLVSHTRHPAGSSGSLCYNCHMPHTSYGMLGAVRSHQIDSPSVAATVSTGRPNACNLCHLDKTLDWTQQKLAGWWSNREPVELTETQRNTSAGLLWLLQGDAGQRALAAWSMGWQPAMQTSKTWWMTPFLAETLTDDYAAVRYIAYRSLKAHGNEAAKSYDYVGEPSKRAAIRADIMRSWRASDEGTQELRALLLRDDRQIDQGRMDELLKTQDSTRVHLRE